MTEQMKYIVKELNSTLGRNYDLIKFDSLNEKQLLQLLADLLVHFNAGEKLDVNEDDTESVSVSLLEMLGSVKYRPPAGVEPARFRAQLLAGDARTLHHVMHWLLDNKEQVKNTAYLAKKIPNSRRRVTFEQLDRLWYFLNTNREVALGYNKTTEARDNCRRMWVEAAKVLNSYEGAEKSWKGWCKYWVDFKSKLRKSAKERLSQEGALVNRELTPIEIKYLNLLGELGVHKQGAKDESSDGEPSKLMEPEVVCDPLHMMESEHVPAGADAQATPGGGGAGPVRGARRRVHRAGPLSAEGARRALVVSSHRREQLDERRNTILDTRLRQLVHAVQQLTDTIKCIYLKIPEIPGDVARNNTVQELLDLYQSLVAEFKEVHRRTRALHDHNAAEIINDIKEMAVERDIVIKRLENVQINLVDVTNRDELLNVSRALRLQQEKAKELENQYESQQSQLKLSSEQLKRYLNVIHGQSAAPKTASDVIKHLQEEIQLNSYLVKEKLPQENSQLQKELNIMQTIATEQHPTRADLLALQDKIAAVNGEMEQLVQRKLATAAPQEDKLAPFRQQATLIRRNKEASAARAHHLAATLREHEASLADLHSQVRQLLGDTVLRGEELKKYVNSLRTKSTIYKRQRANLSTFKAEAGVLARSVQVVCSADPTAEVALLNHKKLNVDEVEAGKEGDKAAVLANKSLHDLSQLVAQSAQKLSQVRAEIQPLVERMKPVKEQFQAVQQQYEQKKRVYEATAIHISSQTEPLRAQAADLAQLLANKENEWKNLRQKITKAESLQEVVVFEMKNAMQSPRQPSKMEALKRSVADLEQVVKHLEEEQRSISSRQGAVEEQSRQWEAALRLLRCKLHARARPLHSTTRMHITHHTQMLTLT